MGVKGKAIAWGLSLIAVLIQFPAIRGVFGIIMPTASDIGIILGIGLIVLIAMEVVKVILRAKVGVGRRINP